MRLPMRSTKSLCALVSARGWLRHSCVERMSSACWWSAAARPGSFPQNTIDLIKTFGAQSAVAIENARLFKNVEASLEDLRTTQDRLVQTQKLASLGQLTAGIAHEIKNPLNFVNNFSGVSAELIDELQETLAQVKADEKTRTIIGDLMYALGAG